MLDLTITDPETNESFDVTYLYPAVDIRDYGKLSTTYYEFMLPFAYGFTIYFMPIDVLAAEIDIDTVVETVVAVDPIDNVVQKMEAPVLRAMLAWFKDNEDFFITYNKTADFDERMLEACIIGPFIAHATNSVTPHPSEFLDFVKKNTKSVPTERLHIIVNEEGGYDFAVQEEDGTMRLLTNLAELLREFVFYGKVVS